MAAETPVLERRPAEKTRTLYSRSQSYAELFENEETHNARIRDIYSRLINPESKIEDVISANSEKQAVEDRATEITETAVAARPYLVENARADSALFRADSPINRVSAQSESADIEEEVDYEEENEDLRPTAETIKYRTIERTSAKAEVKSASSKKVVLGKKEKIMIAVFVGVIIALLALVIINSTVISNLNSEIAAVQDEITTVRGALAGVNSSIADMVPESVRDLLIK